ncbi:MAG TPA: hypothetical protein DEP87_00390 [Candidatus Pacebacteria bacterium]|nr:hypothetical protein [Candidatus Paceibacterota bacterium]
MLSAQTDRFDPEILLKLAKYDLDTESAQIYLFLLENQSKSALEISRALKISRTKVYRILDKLVEKKFLVHEVQAAGLRFLAESPERLNVILHERALVLSQLQHQQGALIKELKQLGGKYHSVQSEVRYYTGLDGLKQLTYNSLSAKKQLLIYELNQDMSKFVNYDFAENVRQELLEHQTTVFQLTNLTKILPHTEVTELIKKFWKVRHVSETEFQIKFEVLIYNHVYALYTYDRGEAFGIEIHNPYLAEMQRQLFRFVWKRAQIMKVTDSRGGAELKP